MSFASLVNSAHVFAEPHMRAETSMKSASDSEDFINAFNSTYDAIIGLLRIGRPAAGDCSKLGMVNLPKFLVPKTNTEPRNAVLSLRTLAGSSAASQGVQLEAIQIASASDMILRTA